MHEIGVVDDIICIIKAKLKDGEKNSKVRRVNILIGELEHVTPDHFEFHFRERTKNTPLEDAKLNFKKVKARFKCKDCNFEFFSEKGLNGCPNCKSSINDVIEGAGIIVESIEIL